MKNKVLFLGLLVVFLAGCQQFGRVGRTSHGVKVLNNLVTELLEVTSVSQPYGEYSFCNPRDGWIFISSRADVAGSGRVRVAIDSQSLQDAVIVHKAGKGQTLEAMRHLSTGVHTLSIWCEGGSSLESISVRTMPELIYSQYGYNSHVKEYGPYDWEFLEKYIVKNANIMLADARHAPPTSVIESWKNQGKWWLGVCGIPGLDKDSKASESYSYWTELLEKSPYLDGLIADEFGPAAKIRGGRNLHSPEQYVHWIDAVERLYANEQFKDKLFYAYLCGGRWLNEPYVSFIQTVIDGGGRVAHERYGSEKPTVESAEEFLGWSIKDRMADFRKDFPGIERHMIYCLGLFSVPPMSLNTNPNVSYKVWMDMHANAIANHPAFKDICGFMWWTSGYADEETIRWVGKLFRHYGIEGKTEMFSKDPYMLTHIDNPDFNAGTEGWTISPAEEGSIEVKKHDGYGQSQGRIKGSGGGGFHPMAHFLWMKRSSKGPNIFSQEIKNLQPGRLYSMKMFTFDYNDLLEGNRNTQTYAVKIEIDNAKMDTDKSFQHVSPRLKGINYHWLVFRARGSTATLKVSDWASKVGPGGPIGQELMYNFIEIEPYLED